MPKILVAENEQSLQKIIEANLSVSGYQVLVASDGEECLRLTQLECPDLILLDLMMPDISGWDILTALKADHNLQKPPVIIMTAMVQENQQRKAFAVGAVGYLVKPFSIDELARQVEQALGKGLLDAPTSHTHR